MHCGEILTQKSWTPNSRNQKSIKNRGAVPQWRKRNQHEPIITRNEFIAVQRLIVNAKYGYKGILPELQVITDGALKGFVSLNPRWGAFRAGDYLKAAASVSGAETDPAEARAMRVEANSGDFDLRGYEVVARNFSIRRVTFASRCRLLCYH
jgi:hypothetical protein